MEDLRLELEREPALELRQVERLLQNRRVEFGVQAREPIDLPSTPRTTNVRRVTLGPEEPAPRCSAAVAVTRCSTKARSVKR